MRVLTDVQRWVKRMSRRRAEQQGSRAKCNDGRCWLGAWLSAAHVELVCAGLARDEYRIISTAFVRTAVDSTSSKDSYPNERPPTLFRAFGACFRFTCVVDRTIQSRRILDTSDVRCTPSRAADRGLHRSPTARSLDGPIPGDNRMQWLSGVRWPGIDLAAQISAGRRGGSLLTRGPHEY